MIQSEVPSSGLPENSTPFSRSLGMSVASPCGSVLTRNGSPEESWPVIASRLIATLRTVPSSTLSRKVL